MFCHSPVGWSQQQEVTRPNPSNIHHVSRVASYWEEIWEQMMVKGTKGTVFTHTHTRNNVRIWIYALIHAYDIWYMILWLASGHCMLSASIASDDINPRWISQNKLYCILNQPGNSPRFLFWKVAKRPKKQLSFHFPSVLWPWRHCLEQAGQPKGWGGWRPSSLMKLPVVFNEKKTRKNGKTLVLIFGDAKCFAAGSQVWEMFMVRFHKISWCLAMLRQHGKMSSHIQ